MLKPSQKQLIWRKKEVLSLVGDQALTKEIKKCKIYYRQSSFQVYFCREMKSNSRSPDKVLLQPCFICKLSLMNYPLMVRSLWFHLIVAWIPLFKHFGVPCTAPFYMLNFLIFLRFGMWRYSRFSVWSQTFGPHSVFWHFNLFNLTVFK